MPIGQRSSILGSILSTVPILLAFAAAYYLFCVFRLRRLTRDGSQAALADFLFGVGGLLLAPFQRRRELEGLRVLLMKEDPPAVVVEIGRAWGGTLAFLCGLSRRDALVISVDLPGGGFSGPLGLFSGAWKAPLWRAAAGPGRRLILIDGDSHAAATRERVRALLAGRTIDLLFIDGDHRYDGVKADFEDYSPLCAPRGRVVFHDINPGPAEYGGDVSRYWSELRLRHPVQEIVADPGSPCFGLGVLRLLRQPLAEAREGSMLP